MPLISLKTAAHVADLFWPTFVQRDGRILFAGTQRELSDKFESRTALEAFYSHRHVLDEFRTTIPWVPDPRENDPEILAPDWSHRDYSRACELACTMAQMWLAKLEHDFAADRFRVYVTTRNDPIVRFHRVYAGERPWGTDEEAAAQRARGEVFIYESSDPDRVAAV